MRFTSRSPRRAFAAGLRPAARLGLAALTLGLVLGGCAKQEPVITGAIPQDGYRTRHPILLTESMETLDVPVGTQSGRLNESMMSTVAIFGATAMERGASGVTIMVPSGSANESAAYGASRQIAAALRQGGVPAHAISHQPYAVERAAADAPIRLAYPRIIAGLPHKCGNWPDQVVGQHDNTDYYNFGCATQANVAAMAANPSDLVTPQGMEAGDANRRTTVVQKYRQGQPTKTDTGLTKQSVSNVGN